MSVLCWIKTNKPLKIFVRNRVASIRQFSTPDQWHYVNGNINPADLGTREGTLSNLITNRNWWKGPVFLTRLTSWESKEADLVNECELSAETKREFKNSKVETAATETAGLVIKEVNNSVQQSASSVFGPFKLTYCSSLRQAVNRTAYILRFIHNVRHQASERRSGPHSPEEREGTLHYWIRLAQERAYGEEIKALRGGGQVHSRSPLKRMRPHFDHGHLLRVTLRTNEPPVIILPDLHHITSLIVDDAHRRCFHQGTRTTLALLSAEYMVRRTVLRAVSACGRCRRYRGLPYLSPEGSLPVFRTQPTRAFAKVGIDYFGPMYINSGGTKVWGLLVSCATTSAVHLEVVKSQSTDDLQLPLRRFFALGGAPSLIVSDNAKSFRKLSNQLPPSTRWRYIPKAAPWWGGFWE